MLKILKMITFALYFISFIDQSLMAQPVPVMEKRAGNCSALTPNGWSASTNPQSSTFDSFSSDGRAYAGWGILGVNPFMRQFYGSLYGSPEESILTIANSIGQSIGVTGLSYLSTEDTHDNFFTMRRLKSANGQGIVIFHIYPNTPVSGQYIESMYFALAQLSAGHQSLDAAIGTALSIRCNVQLIPQESYTSSRRTSSKGKQVCEKRSPLSGYNRWLGVQEFHDSLGENHRIYNETPETNGIEGKGYYINRGGTTERLQEGRTDDC